MQTLPSGVVEARYEPTFKVVERGEPDLDSVIVWATSPEEAMDRAVGLIKGDLIRAQPGEAFYPHPAFYRLSGGRGSIPVQHFDEAVASGIDPLDVRGCTLTGFWSREKAAACGCRTCAR